ncbi:anti-sigma factor family protein [Acidobacteriota bacterium]
MKGNKDQHCEDRLQAYLDGELTKNQTGRIEGHLARCPSCRGVLDELKAVGHTMKSEADPEPLRAMWPAVRERLKRPTPAPRHRAAFAMATSAVAVIGVVLGLFLGMWKGEASTVATDGAWAEIATTLTAGDAISLSDIYLAAVPEEGGQVE